MTAADRIAAIRQALDQWERRAQDSTDTEAEAWAHPFAAGVLDRAEAGLERHQNPHRCLHHGAVVTFDRFICHETRDRLADLDALETLLGIQQEEVADEIRDQ